MKFGRITAVLLALIALFIWVDPVFATALSANRDTPQIVQHTQVSLTVKDAEIIYAGSIVAVDSNGEAVSATDSATDQVVGRAAEYVDNTDDGETIKVDVGIFGWAKSGTINDANIGDIVYVVDDQTVSTSDPGNGCIAGVVVDQDSTYAYVDTSYLPRTAGTFTTLSASGAVTMGSTLAVTGNTTVGGTLGVTGATTLSSTLAVTGAATLSSTADITGSTEVGDLGDSSVASAAAVTNGQAVSLSGLIVRLNSSGGANNATNTITLSNLSAGENGVFYVINTGSSNNLAIAQSGTFKSPALYLEEYAMAVIVAPVSNAFYACESN